MADPEHEPTVSIPPSDPSEDGSTLAFRPDPDPIDTTFTAADGPRPVGEGPKPVGLPGYEILDELGRGGMGVVYRARQVRLNRVVALKMILGGGHASAKDLLRFVSEAEAAAAVQHVGIVQVYEAGHHDGLPYLALEFCPGGTLAKRLEGTPMPANEAARLVVQLARAVQAAHDSGIVHRDLKPANALFAQDGTPKVSDFGLARRGDSGSGLTATGAIMGTPSYMAPEQARGAKEVGPAADVYSLGAILYECLTGRPPFKAATPMETVIQVQMDEPVAPSRLVPKLPRDLETICLKCLAKEPHRRYASAASLADDLLAYLDGRTIQARPASAPERGWRWVKRNPAPAALLGVIALAVAAVVGVLASANASLQRERDAAQKARDDAEHERAMAALSEETAKAAEELAEEQKKLAELAEELAHARLGLAVAAVDAMLIRVAGERWARRPELREERRQVLQDAVGFFQLLAKSETRDPQLRRETVNANRRAAEALTALGDSKAALAHYGRAVALQREIVADDPAEAGAHTQLASLLTMQASMELILANYQPAETGYKEAIEVARRAVRLENGDGPQPPGSPTAGAAPVPAVPSAAMSPQVALVECLSMYAHFISNRDPVTSGQLLDETLGIARRLVRGGNKSYSVRLCLAQSLSNRLAIDLSHAKASQTAELLAEAEQLLTDLQKEEPPSARLADVRDVTRVQALENRAGLLLRTGNPADAVTHYRDALVIVEDLLTFQPSYFTWLYRRLLLRIQIGEALYQAGKLDEAQKSLADVDAAERAVLAVYPQHTWIPGQSSILRSYLLIERARRGDDLLSLRDAFDALLRKTRIDLGRSVRYNRACAFSRAAAATTGQEREEWAREAVHELTKLRDDRYFTSPMVAHLDDDPDLHPIRGRPDYQAFRRSLPAEQAPAPRPR